MLRTCAVFVAWVGLFTPAMAAPPAIKADPNPKSLEIPQDELSKARELVQKLGSEVFAEREAAERALAEMGRLARPALLDGVNRDPDPEIRLRCCVLLPKATTEEYQARLDAFMADTDGKYEHNLPGWHKLRSAVRGEWTMLGWTFTARPNTDKAARELFIEFMKAPGGRKLLLAMGDPPGELGQLIANRKQELYNAKYPRVGGIPPRALSVAEVAVVVFAESQINSRHIPRSTVFTAVISTSGLASAAIGNDERAKALQAVMTAWLNSRTEPLELYPALTLANNIQNTDAAGRIAVRMMTTPGIQGFYKGQALATLVRLKLIDQVPAIEKAFTDTSILNTTVRIVNGKQVRQSIEVRDAALAAALVMTGQDPNDYGFESFPKNAGATNFSYTWARITDEKRKEAFEKWKAWREKNP